MKKDIKDMSPVSCVVKIANSDYVKKENIIYEGMEASYEVNSTIFPAVDSTTEQELGTTMPDSIVTGISENAVIVDVQ